MSLGPYEARVLWIAGPAIEPEPEAGGTEGDDVGDSTPRRCCRAGEAQARPKPPGQRGGPIPRTGPRRPRAPRPKGQ